MRTVGTSAQEDSSRPKARTQVFPCSISSRQVWAANRPVLPKPATEMITRYFMLPPPEKSVFSPDHFVYHAGVGLNDLYHFGGDIFST